MDGGDRCVLESDRAGPDSGMFGGRASRMGSRMSYRFSQHHASCAPTHAVVRLFASQVACRKSNHSAGVRCSLISSNDCGWLRGATSGVLPRSLNSEAVHRSSSRLSDLREGVQRCSGTGMQGSSLNSEVHSGNPPWWPSCWVGEPAGVLSIWRCSWHSNGLQGGQVRGSVRMVCCRYPRWMSDRVVGADGRLMRCFHAGLQVCSRGYAGGCRMRGRTADRNGG